MLLLDLSPHLTIMRLSVLFLSRHKHSVFCIYPVFYKENLISNEMEFSVGGKQFLFNSVVLKFFALPIEM